MKKHSPTVFAKDLWQEIELLFWREHVPCLPAGTTGDGIDPVFIEATKRGIEISAMIWFLPAGSYELSLCLARPSFSSFESVSVQKLRRAAIIDSSLHRRTLRVTVADPLAATDVAPAD